MTDAPMIQETIREGMTLAEFIQRFDAEGPFEIIAGEIVPKMPNVFGHTEVANLIAFLINLLTRPAKLGEAVVEVTIIRPDSYDREWVKGALIPDVAYFVQERLDAYRQAEPDYRSKPLMLVPDIAVEVISPTDKHTDISDKIRRYLADGVRLVLIVDPQLKTIALHRPDSNQITLLSGDAVLTAEGIIPGLALKLSEIFPA